MSRVIARYTYENVKGAPRLQKVRFEPKKFLMLSWHEKGQTWAKGVTDARFRFWTTALYKLPELVAALRVDVPVWWCEGEKDAEALMSLGLTATTTPNPSELFTTQARWFTKYDSQSEVMVVCDADPHGGWWGWERYRSLLRVGVDPARIHVVAPRLGLKDAHEHVEAGLSAADMRPVDLARLEKTAKAYRADHARAYSGGRYGGGRS